MSVNESLSAEERAEARRQFGVSGEDSRVCSFCGGLHTRACPRVERFELFENGKLKSVSFWREDEWDDSFIVWPEMAFDEDDEAGGETNE